MAKTKASIKTTAAESETPLMKQYNTIKAKYPDALLLFRVGDFYETFGADAVKAANILGIVLTKRANGYASYIELAGFPHHSLDTYLPKLVRAGQRVAICDQLEDPKMTKTIVKRGVTELVTPGVSYNDKVLEHRSNNFLASIFLNDKNSGISFLDISTGEFLVAQGNLEYIDKLLQSFRPTEVLFQKNKKKLFIETFGEKFYTYGLEDWAFTSEYGNDLLLKHFGTKSLKGFGIENLEHGIIAAGAALHYLADTAHDKVKHISTISRIEEEKYVWLDRFTIRNLELFGSQNENAKTLIDVIDQTVSPMGSRMLKRWLALPLKDKAPIEERLDIVDYFLSNPEIAEHILKNIELIGDLERITSKVATARISPKEMVQLKRALTAIEPIKDACENSKNRSLQKIAEQLNPCRKVIERIEKEILPDPPYLVSKGNVIANDVSAELDELRKIAFSGKDYLLQIQQRESERTGISSLKVAFNNVFGYYLEVTNTHKDKVPGDWMRKQTLTNAERYITPELKEYEEKILGAEEKIVAIETRLFNDLVMGLMDYIPVLQLNSSLIGRLDCLLSFATIAQKNNYVRPHIFENDVIDIKDGRHPVIEKQLPIGEDYIANDIYLDNDQQQIIIITGPNMSGKSALLRQTALIVLMAQMGSFVPAKHANLGLVDKVFTRVGASDNISSGESTFMVEMNETASILNNLSSKSLIILDEIGRGTSTYDGISIAWAISEYIHENPSARAKTLFATHYHELNEMTNSMHRIKNFSVSVKEINNKILFMRKLIPGGSEHSFGIHVAKMAGMPKKVIDRANQLLVELESQRDKGDTKNQESRQKNQEKGHKNQESKNKSQESRIKTQDGFQPATNSQQASSENMQLSFFQLNDPVLENIKEELQRTDINTLTPVEALMKLNEIKKMIGG
ncbi:MAG: DNA mismatch repair protein MutS [Bacteroidetes bacterium RIFCSPLOWO2_12_FULL_35_15]|nr:MAG: DNA mismatch repair protein MutS [Bacteroidetes bacterium RIFCSPLOWO2_12_FULL_35_15]